MSQSGGGLFGAFHSAPDIDCDASVFMLTDYEFINKNDLVYFGNLESACLSVVHSGDNLTGDGDYI